MMDICRVQGCRGKEIDDFVFEGRVMSTAECIPGRFFMCAMRRRRGRQRGGSRAITQLRHVCAASIYIYIYIHIHTCIII